MKKEKYTYIELGDGDELWENRKLSDIINEYSGIFWLLGVFFAEGRLRFILGNHDIVKKRPESFSIPILTTGRGRRYRCFPE